MLSIVICSVNSDYLSQVKKCIEATIGVPYELLIWENRATNEGLCRVYNRMAEKAQYPYICFLHEDILFETLNWGRILADVFKQDEAIGLIGVAGANFKGRAYSGWFTGQNEIDRYNITHRINGIDEKMLNPKDTANYVHQVVCIDGVFMVCRKDVWNTVKFDEEFLKGFHLYDIDFSLRTSRLFKVMVVTNISIVHITQGGDYGNTWVDETINYHLQRKSLLPWPKDIPSAGNFETRIEATWLDSLKDRNISFYRRMRWVRLQGLYAKPGLWYAIIKFIVYRPLKLKYIHNLFKKK